jgi:hypothetical protein
VIAVFCVHSFYKRRHIAAVSERSNACRLDYLPREYLTDSNDLKAWDVDYGRRPDLAVLLVMLRYSRLLWCRFYPRQEMATLIDGLEDAFLSFGGLPRELLFDQMKAVITRDLRLEGGTFALGGMALAFLQTWLAVKAIVATVDGGSTRGEFTARDVKGDHCFGRMSAKTFFKSTGMVETTNRSTDLSRSR